MENWEREWRDYYRVLGVYPDSDYETVSAVYRRLARKFGVPGGSEPDEAKFRLINEAKEVLTDLAKRAAYDREYRRRNPSDQSSPPPGADHEGSKRPDGESASTADGSNAGDPEDANLHETSRRSAADETGGDGAPGPVRRKFTVAVDYDRPVSDVALLAEFDTPWILHNDCLASFRPARSGTRTIQVELLRTGVDYEKTLGRIDDEGYRSLDALELLWFAIAFPAEQFKRRIRAYHRPLRVFDRPSMVEIGTEGKHGRYCQALQLDSFSTRQLDEVCIAITPREY